MSAGCAGELGVAVAALVVVVVGHGVPVLWAQYRRWRTSRWMRKRGFE